MPAADRDRFDAWTDAIVAATAGGGDPLAAGDADAAEPGDGARDRARWLVRVVVSLLTHPGADRDDERRLLTRFVAPVVVGA